MKNIFYRFILVIFLSFITLPTIAASLNEKIPLYFKLVNENLLAGQNSLSINLCDTRIKNWCVRPNRDLGLAGQKINEYVTIEPGIAGEWRFGWNYDIFFTPHEYFIANQNYKIIINDKAIFPQFVNIDQNNINFATLPLLPNIKEMNYLQDNDKKLIQTKIKFNYPINPKTLEERLSFVKSTTKEKLPFTVQFNDNNTEATIITNIKSLEDSEYTVTLTIDDGVKPLYGGEDFNHKNIDFQKYSYKQQVLVPSLSSYLKITKAVATIVKDNKNIPQQIIIVTTNAPISGEEVKNHLELLLLPKDKPASLRGNLGKKDYAWQSPKEITEDVLQAAEKVNFELLPSASENSTLHSFKIDTISSRYLLLTIKQGMETKENLVLGSDYSKVLQVPSELKEVKLMSNGSILSLSGEKKLSVYSIGIDKLHVEIDKINQNDINHLISQTNRYNTFQNPTFINKYSFDEYNISEVFEEDIAIDSKDISLPHYSTLDFKKYLKPNSSDSYSKGLFLTKVSYKDKNGNNIAEDKRLILVTDLGFIVKTDKDGLHHIFVSSVSNGKPARGVTANIIGLNGEVLTSGVTDSEGYTPLPSVRNFTKEKKPVAYVLTGDDDFSFMPYGRIDREVNYSRFDVSGTQSSPEGLKAYLFSDRGIYKPGEQGHIGILVKQSDWQSKFAGLPLELQVTNPHGKIIDKKKVFLNEEGFTEYLFQTSENSFTGSYNISLYLTKDKDTTSYLNNLSVSVEDFLPDRMKINIDFDIKDKLWIAPEKLKATVSLNNLYGLPATNRKITSYIEVNPAKFSVAAFKGYVFYSGKDNKESFYDRLGDVSTDEKGIGQFDLNLAKYDGATYKLTFSVEGFEPDSGRSVNASKSIIVSPLPYIIGFKTANDLKHLKQQSNAKVEFIAVDSDGNKINAEKLQLILKKTNYINSLVANGDGSYSYQSIPIESPLSFTEINITKKSGYIYNLPTKELGDYVIYLTDKNNTIFAQTEFSVLGEGNIAANLIEKTNLILKLNKSDYKSGEKILVNVIAPYTGYGLITIETDKVHNFTWFKADQTSSIQEIKIPADFAGKGFINVQFMRELDSKEIFVSPFSYASLPFTADIYKHEQKIELTVPEQIKSGEKLTVNYRTSNPGKIIIFAIDEGILSFSNYKTPDPLNYFIKDKALEVSTSHIMDLILPENSIMMKSFMAAPGGGEYMSLNKNLNPFKRQDQPPVAFWSGIIDSTLDKKQVTFDIPDYFNGTLRVMAIAANLDSVGSTDVKLYVQSDFIISSNLPLFITPNDEFIAPVTIANNVKNSGNAKVSINIETSEGLKILDYPREIKISEGTEASINVKLKATERLGSASFKVTASLNNTKSVMTSTASVRPPLPNVTTIDTGYEPLDKITLKTSRDLYKEFAKLQISASNSPLAIITGFKSYLDNYPFACTEQLVSRNFANVMLYNEQELVKTSDIERKKIDESLHKAFQTLSERQNYDGGFNMWSNQGSASDDFISIYAIHFLTESTTKYLPVPSDTFASGLDYLKNTANRSINSLNSAREKAYAVYILTKNNEITTNYIANILNYLETSQKDNWRDDLTAVYLAASYKMLQMNEEANNLLDSFTLNKAITPTTISDYQYYNALIKYSQYLYIISQHFPERLKTIDKSIVQDIAKLSNDSYNTLAASYAIMASVAYADNIDNVEESNITVKTYSNDKEQQELTLTGNKIMTADILANDTQNLKLTSSTKGFFYQLLTSGFDKSLNDNKEIIKGIEISKKYLDENNKEVSKVKLGENIIVSLTLRSGNKDTLNDIVVLDLLPAGFELLLTNNNINILRNDDKTLIWQPVNVDRRDDRVILFGTIPNYEIKYQYKIKAINKGIFATPAIYSESMYNPQIYYRGVIGSIIVE
ncbi:alpha-2-macroglobulin family protein [Rickettsia endosymbiont of Halotydeus destructor]|uniref:alpha-2-macroglobulin family protein n=1 Tax=Rickettsia endosymbiont of Halotydeus destructor TaxID=2996754 RepID=UPI003BB146BE